MATHPVHHPVKVEPKPPIRTTPPAPHPTAQAATVTAIRQGVTSPAPQASVYAPWDQLLAKAESRLKVEITAALNQLVHDTGQAGQLLDTTSATATEAAARLEALAWDTWHKFMGQADAIRNGLTDTAVAAYSGAIDAAHQRYQAAVKEATTVYSTLLADAQSAQAGAKLPPS